MNCLLVLHHLTAKEEAGLALHVVERNQVLRTLLDFSKLEQQCVVVLKILFNDLEELLLP